MNRDFQQPHLLSTDGKMSIAVLWDMRFKSMKRHTELINLIGLLRQNRSPLKSVRPDRFWQKKAAKIGPGDRFWRRTGFFVTGHFQQKR